MAAGRVAILRIFCRVAVVAPSTGWHLAHQNPFAPTRSQPASQPATVAVTVIALVLAARQRFLVHVRVEIITSHNNNNNDDDDDCAAPTTKNVQSLTSNNNKNNNSCVPFRRFIYECAEDLQQQHQFCEPCIVVVVVVDDCSYCTAAVSTKSIGCNSLDRAIQPSLGQVDELFPIRINRRQQRNWSQPLASYLLYVHDPTTINLQSWSSRDFYVASAIGLWTSYYAVGLSCRRRPWRFTRPATRFLTCP